MDLIKVKSIVLALWWHLANFYIKICLILFFILLWTRKFYEELQNF